MQNQRHCSWVHDTMFINPLGDVFPCCHEKPSVVGNIYKSTLRDIYNDDRIQELRKQEMDGSLACLNNCTLPQSQRVHDVIQHDYDKDLLRLQIHFGERCNIMCIMCTQDHKNKIELDHEVIVNNIDIPLSRPTVIFQGGEPLVLKSARQFFDHCAENGSKIGLITNGIAIGEEMAKKIAIHCSSINFSLNAATKEIHEIVNAGSRFEKVTRNIKKVIDAKREFDGGVTIMGHMTIVKENIHEIPQFISKQAEFGFERINFGFDRTVPGILSDDPELKASLASDISDEIAKSERPRRIDTARLRMLGLV
jgi:MoaA/NifB/PqqE/SkfB family radical SAM enzyme